MGAVSSTMSAGYTAAGDTQHAELEVVHLPEIITPSGAETASLENSGKTTPDTASESRDYPSKQGDVELGGEEAEKIPLTKVEEQELTPMEAFKWNVDGDQSPCR
jgi:hypothetical protein